MLIQLKVKKYNTILIEKQQKFQHYLPVKLINLTIEDILPSDQSRIIEQEKFKYFLLGKAFEKQIKAIENQGEKQMGKGSMENK